MNRPLPSLQVLALASLASVLPLYLSAQSGKTITGQAAFADFTQQHPGVRRKITVADLPGPKEDEAVDNGAGMVPRPNGAWPEAPRGFKVELYAEGRAGEVKVLRGVTADGKAKTVSVYASGLDHPFGINFYPNGPHPQWVYV